jgi:signal transduction histidine kinase
MNDPVSSEADPPLEIPEGAAVDGHSVWEVLVVGDSPSLRAAFEASLEGASGVVTGWRCRGRSLRLTQLAGELAALEPLEPGRFQVAVVGLTDGPLPLCQHLRAASASLRILLGPEAGGLGPETRMVQGDPSLEALDLDSCPSSDPQALRAMVRAALRHADDAGALDAARTEILRQMTIRERLEGIAAMVTGITHDVSTPLGVACTAGSVVEETARRMLNTDLREEDAREELREDLRDALDILTRSLDRARRLIDSFKQFSASQFSNERAKVQLADVVTDCVMVLRSELRRAQIALEVHAPPDEDLRWDGFPGHLGRVLVNLLQNSMRYAFEPGKGGKVSILLDRSVDGQGFVLQFIDDGKGIEADVLPRIFDAFFTTGRGSGGTGLGLAISHNIVVNLLGGTIRCESTPGQGATFTITLPAVATGDGGHYVNGLQEIMPAMKNDL